MIDDREGFYLMHRGWMDSGVFADDLFNEKSAWEWMIGEAAWKDCTIPVLGRPTKLKRGQLCHSLRFMARKFNWSKSAVDRFLEKLKKWDMVTTETGTGQLIITVCNYSKYQDFTLKDRDRSGTGTGTGAGQERDKQEPFKPKKEAVDDSARDREFFRRIYDSGSELFPALATKRTEVINQWIAAGADPELVLSEFCRAVGRDVRTWGYFSGMIMDAIKTRDTPLPQGSSRPAAARKPNDWQNTLDAGRKAYERRTKAHDDTEY